MSTTKRSRGVLSYLGLGVSAGLLALVLALAAFTIVIPAATGATPLTVLTGSMIPTYPPGTLVIVRPVDTKQLQIGDAVTYQLVSGKPDLVTHRVIQIIHSSDGSETFVTKGDNNAVADANPVLPEQIQGRVWYSIPWFGYVNTFLTGGARGWVIPLIAGGLFLYVGYLGVSGIVGAARRRSRR